MNTNNILDLLKSSNALLEGHFVLTSGLHSPQYVEKFRLLEQPKITETLCKELANKFKDENISVVVGPMTGGIILSHEIGKQLGTKAIFTERVDLPEAGGRRMKFRRGFSLNKDDRVLIVEDIITTGGSVLEVIEAVKEFGSQIIGIGCLVDRSNGNASFPYHFKPLLKLNVVAWKQEDCPLCKENIPVTKPGSTNKEL